MQRYFLSDDGQPPFWLVTLAFSVVLLVTYLPFHEAGYVFDYVGWKERADAGGFWGAFHTYDYRGHLQLYALMMWAIEEMRPVSTVVTQIALCLMGGFAAASGSAFVVREVRSSDLAFGPLIGLGSGLLWVLSPAGTELYVLKICPHYLVTAILWFTALRFTQTYLVTRKASMVYTIWLIQLAGLPTLEYAYALPLILGTFLAWRLLTTPTSVAKSDWWRLFAVPVGIVMLHPLATKLVYGVWIGHYGAEVATALPITEIAAAPWRWITRYLMFSRYWAFDVRTAFNNLLGGPLTAVYGACFMAALWAAYQLTHHRQVRSWHFGLLLLALAGLSAAPISQLYFYDLQIIENDRLGSLTNFFAGASLLTFLSAFGKRVLGFGLTVMLCASVYFLREPLDAWRSSQAVLVGLIDSARDHLSRQPGPDTVFLLGYVNSVRGANVFSDVSPEGTGFGSHVTVMHPETNWPHFVEVAQFNQQSLTDTINAEEGNDRLYVALDADGAWWWRKQYGLGEFADSVAGYRVTVHPYHYELFLDRMPPGGRTGWHQQGSSFQQITFGAD